MLEAFRHQRRFKQILRFALKAVPQRCAVHRLRRQSWSFRCHVKQNRAKLFLARRSSTLYISASWSDPVRSLTGVRIAFGSPYDFGCLKSANRAGEDKANLIRCSRGMLLHRDARLFLGDDRNSPCSRLDKLQSTFPTAQDFSVDQALGRVHRTRLRCDAASVPFDIRI